MAIELLLRQTHASGRLLPALFTQALAVLAKVAPIPSATMHGQELRVVDDFDFNDNACVGFVLTFAGQGDRVLGTAHGPSAPALAWGFHVLALALKCTLEEEGAVITPLPEAHREAALAYLRDYEAEVTEHRAEHRELAMEAFLGWLVREEHLALVPGADLGDLVELPLDKPAELYETLLDHDAVEEVFASERDLTRLLARFTARARPT